MKNQTKNMIAISVGLITGGAVGYYLNTEKGKKMRKQVYDTIQNQAGMAAEKLSHAADNFKTQVDHVAETVKNKISNVSESAEGAVDAAKKKLENGADTAKSKLKSAS